MTRLATRASRPTRPNRKPRVPTESRASSGRRLPTPPLAVGIVLVVLAVALMAALLAGSGDDSSSSSGSGSGDDVTSGGTATDTASALPRLDESAGSDDPALGMRLPTLAGTDVAGDPMTIAADGRPKLIVFLAHWCPHCQREVPVVQDWVDRGGLPDGVDLVAAATAIDERRPNYPPDEWLAREGWTAPVLYDHDDSAAEAAGLSAFPYFVATDGHGAVVARTTGELTEAQLETLAHQAETAG